MRKAASVCVVLCTRALNTEQPQLGHSQKTQINITGNMVKSHKDKVVHKAMKSIDKIYNEVPGKYKQTYRYNKILQPDLLLAFGDIFDEDTWYQFCFMFVCCTIVCVFLLSR